MSRTVHRLLLTVHCSLMFWILVFSYWVHLLATAVWLVCVVVMAATAVPAFRQQQLAENSWLALQKRLLPWTNLSLVLLLWWRG